MKSFIIFLFTISIYSSASEIYSNRFLTSNTLENVYGPAANQIIEENIINQPNVFSGPCSLMEVNFAKSKKGIINNSNTHYCRKGVNQSKAQLYSNDLKLRFSLTKRTCDSLYNDKRASKSLIDNLSSHTALTKKIESLILSFYPTMASPDIFAKEVIKEIINENNFSLKLLYDTNISKRLFLALHKNSIIKKSAHLLCNSEKWQKLSSGDSELNKYYKCHKVFTQTNVSVDDPTVLKIKSSELSATKACLQLIDKATLNKEGIIHNYKDNFKGKNVLRTFQAFHNTWFPNYMTYMPDDSPLLYDLIELEEPALYITRSLFTPGSKYKDTLKGMDSLTGIRSAKYKPNYMITAGIDDFKELNNKYPVITSDKKELFWKPTLLDRGEIIGLKKINPGTNILPSYSTRLFFPNIVSEPIDINQNMGGGILGLNSYIIFNNGRPHGELADGKFSMMRAYSRNIVRDLMCRDLPVINPKDSVTFINRSSKLSWSQGKNCMACHATIDTMAGLIRNSQLVINIQKESGSSHMKIHKATKSIPKGYKLFDHVDDYHLTNPSGHFVYRDIDNVFISKKVMNLDELGVEISKTKDFYACATVRYLHFLTGKKVSLNQFQSIEDKELKIFINQTSKELDKTQDLRVVIKRILDSKWF
jgi:hypothetical protein